MARELLRSVDGRQLPNLGEVAVYWPNVDCSSIYDTTGFEFTDKPDNGTYPELIEHDAEATANELLGTAVALLEIIEIHKNDIAAENLYRDFLEAARAAIAKATGSQA